MRINLSLAQLQAFVQVAEGLSFRAAAQSLHLSQPALSRTIKMAEDQLRTRLFDRDTRHVALTPAGRELLPIARRILDEFDSAFSELSQFLEGRSGHVTVVALPSIGVALIPQAVAAFRQRHPQVEFTLLEAQARTLLAMVDAGQADVGVSVRPEPDSRLNYRHLADDPFALVCRRDDPLAASHSAPWSVFASRPFIASDTGSSIRSATDAAFVRSGLSVRPTLTFPSVAAGGALVAQGLGLTALPRLALSLAPIAALATVKLRQPAVSRPLGIVTRAGRTLSPVSRGFIEQLATLVADDGLKDPVSGKAARRRG